MYQGTSFIRAVRGLMTWAFSPEFIKAFGTTHHPNNRKSGACWGPRLEVVP
jgi:hypothetical protein